jgi:hypothetical protein
MLNKPNGFVAPYKSETFRQQVDALLGKTCLLRMEGEIVSSVSTVLIPPFDASQQGLLLRSTTLRTVNKPAHDAPYYLAVSAPSANPIDDLIVTFPKDITALGEETVLLGFYDGTSWSTAQELSNQSILESLEEANKYDRGVKSGLVTSLEASNYKTTSGTLVDRQGRYTVLPSPAYNPVVLADPVFSRVDRIVYRRPEDVADRLGAREFCLGPSFQGSTIQHIYPSPDIAFAASSGKHSKPRTVVASDGSNHIFSARGYGVTFEIVYKKLASDFSTTTVAEITLAAPTTDAFDVCQDTLGNLHLIYIKNGSIFAKKFSSSGVQLIAEFPVYSAAAKATDVRCAYSATIDDLFIFSKVQATVSSSRIFLQGLTNGSAYGITVSPRELSFGVGNFISFDAVVTPDMEIFVVAENVTNTQILLKEFDIVGASVGTTTVVSLSVDRIGYTALSGGAKNPRVHMYSNRELVVTFLQDKGSSAYGLSLWRNKDAFMPTLISPTESFTGYDFFGESFLNAAHFSLRHSGGLTYSKVEGRTVRFTSQVIPTVMSESVAAFGKTGAVSHIKVTVPPTTFTDYVGPVTIERAGVQVYGSQFLNILPNQLIISTALLSSPPKVAERLVIATSTVGNNGTYFVTDVDLAYANVPNDFYLVTLNNPLSTDGGTTSVATLAKPDGTQVTFSRSTAEIAEKAYRLDVLASDLLLARMDPSTGEILNHSPTTVAGTELSTVERMAAFAIAPFTIDWEGTAAGALTFAGDLIFTDLVNNHTYNINDGSYALSEGKALFVVPDLAQSVLTPVSSLISSIPWSDKPVIIGIIKNGKFVPHALIAAVGIGVLDSGEFDGIGTDLPNPIRSRLGIVSDTQFEAYSSTQVIDAVDSYPVALSKLDAAVDFIRDDVPEEETFVVTSATNTYTSSSLVWSGNNTDLDIVVTVNGKKQIQDKTGASLKDYRKTLTNVLLFTYTLQAGAEINIRKERTGGGNVGSVTVELNDVAVQPVAQIINFTGAGVSATVGVGGQVNVVINGAGSVLNVMKTVRNATGGTLNPNSVVAWADDGSVVLADANTITVADIAGIVVSAIPNGAFGSIFKFGECLDVLTGLGAIPGQLVFLSETAGQASLTPPLGLSDAKIILGRAEPASGLYSAAANTLFLSPQIVSL